MQLIARRQGHVANNEACDTDAIARRVVLGCIRRVRDGAELVSHHECRNGEVWLWQTDLGGYLLEATNTVDDVHEAWLSDDVMELIENYKAWARALG